MPEPIVPQATPIPSTGEPTWYPPPQDDAEAHRQEPGGFHRVLIGPDGLRAGWSLLLFLFITFGIGLLSFQALVALHVLPKDRLHGEVPPLLTIVTELVQFAAPVLAALIMARVERRRFSQYGLSTVRGGQFAAGLLWGFGALSLLVAALWASGVLTFTGRLLGGAGIVAWGAVWAVGFLLVGLAEEFTTRGYVQFTVARGVAGVGRALGMDERGRKVLGFWVAALIFSFIFGFGHKGNPGESPIGLWSAGLIGMVFCFSLWRTGSLWWAVGMHAAWDWAQSFVYGVADSGQMVQHHLQGTHPQGRLLLSGGTTGPEGSVYVLATIAVVAAGVALTLKSRPGSPSQPETWTLSAPPSASETGRLGTGADAQA